MRRHEIDICVIDDDEAQCALLRARFLREQYSVVTATTGEEGYALVSQHLPRVVLCDLMLPGLDGVELARRLRADASLDGVYLVLVTAVDEPEQKIRALLAGADDYITKPYNVVELVARVRNGMRICRLQERLSNAAMTDGLTDLANHTTFRSLLEVEFSRTRRYGGSVSLLMIDLDHFKAVNDNFGHEAGNEVLRATARHITSVVRDMDVVARYGGEEFAVILPQTDESAAGHLAERIRETTPRAVAMPDAARTGITLSVGVASSSDARVGAAVDLINLADTALYASKRFGRNRVTLATELPDQGDHALLYQDVDQLRKQVVSLSLHAKEVCLQSIWALVQALETRDAYTARHSHNVRFIVERVAERAGWSLALRETTSNAAMLHDLGKIGVPDRVLLKPGPLTPDEAVVMRHVPLLTCKILEPLRIFETEIQIIRHIRERYDGTGFPDGLFGAAIPLGSRLVAIAEAFVAMTSGRRYRATLAFDDALAEIVRQSGMQFDPELVGFFETALHAESSRWQDTLAAGAAVAHSAF